MNERSWTYSFSPPTSASTLSPPAKGFAKRLHDTGIVTIRRSAIFRIDLIFSVAKI